MFRAGVNFTLLFWDSVKLSMLIHLNYTFMKWLRLDSKIIKLSFNVWTVEIFVVYVNFNSLKPEVKIIWKPVNWFADQINRLFLYDANFGL